MSQLFVDFYLAHGAIHLLEVQSLKRDLFGDEELQGFVFIDEVNLA